MMKNYQKAFDRRFGLAYYAYNIFFQIGVNYETFDFINYN